MTVVCRERLPDISHFLKIAVVVSRVGDNSGLQGGHQGTCADVVLHSDGARHPADGHIQLLIQSLCNGVFLCAGVSDTTLAKFYTREKIDRVLNVNVIAPAMMLRYLLGKKKINKNGSLVWMSSAGAEEVEPGLGIYAASKSAVNGLMRTYAKELLGRKIRSNSIMPMMIKTELVGTLSNISDDQWKKQEEMYPLGFGNPLDVAYLAMYLPLIVRYV